VELADLTRGMRKNDFLEPEKLFFLQSWAGLSFIRLVCKKKIESEKLFFLQSWAGLSFMRLVCKNNFSELEKLFLCRALFP
jgi:hypothetical protein